MSGGGDEPKTDGQSTRDIAELVRSVANVMHQADVSELDLDVGDMKLRLRRPLVNATIARETTTGIESSSVLAPRDEQFITAPMIGTFYASPSPGTPPFVVVGDPVQMGQPVGIIEAMKIMNEISADRSGVVEAVLVENGQPVEYGTPLLRLAVGTVAGT